ncbi:uncharacterized protein LOC107274508 [Cephus cinctus]|uniref:Uncharacterized protein LOC107274508 n=1 Tax=Cephus cinctus TaxID=211228 RepID=A0AAJ7W7M5_CEPCN|nr:uncharacterized protein LOC107274508 [Cephus cinctus]
MPKPSCALCFTNVEKAGDGIASKAPCKHNFHVGCVIMRLAVDSAVEATAAVRQCCPIYPPKDDKLSVLRSINESLSKLDVTMAKVDTLVADVGKLNTKMDALTENNSKFKAEFLTIKQTVNAVKKDLGTAVENIKAQGSRLEIVEERLSNKSVGLSKTDKAILLRVACQSMAIQLVIMGVSEFTGDGNEDLNEFVPKLTCALDVDLSPADVVRVERMGRLRKRTSSSMVNDHVTSRAIVLELATKVKCDQFIVAKKHHPNLKSSNIDSGYLDSKIYINRRQPIELQKLRNQVLKKCPSLNPRAVWIADAAVYIRKDMDAKPYRVLSISDLSELTL